MTFTSVAVSLNEVMNIHAVVRSGHWEDIPASQVFLDHVDNVDNRPEVYLDLDGDTKSDIDEGLKDFGQVNFALVITDEEVGEYAAQYLREKYPAAIVEVQEGNYGDREVYRILDRRFQLLWDATKKELESRRVSKPAVNRPKKSAAK